ncbi:hypothetical protein [Streptomyces sp. LUP30]|uniref:hypothetical protein n=1 Tax=Streptomyces sp. LUP30 TaxID=1890285 RepID=UPI0021093B59|nr:hypothetical protein [Streptomyces sp. LUP30]
MLRSPARSLQGGAVIHGQAGRSPPGGGSQEKLNVTLVEPELVAEVGVDVARDASGRWRHPARWHRARPDITPADVHTFTPL